MILLASFFIHFVFGDCLNRERLTLFILHFLETDIREHKKYKMRTQTSLDNTENDLRYEFKFENCVKNKNNLFIKRNIAFLS